MKKPHVLRVSIFVLMIVLLITACSAPSNDSSVPVTATTPTTAAAAVATATTASPTAAEPAATETQAAETQAVETPTVGATSGDGGTRYEIVEGSKARYRIREQLANLDLPNDAIGETDQVSGAIVLNTDGTVDQEASRIEVDLSTLQSDNNRRDGYVRENVLQTNQYPTAVFVPTSITGLSNPLPDSGDVNFQLTGNMTIRDVTKEITWNVTGTVNGDQATGQAITSFPFADFNLTQPRVPIVLSVEDNITLELDIVLQRTSTGSGQEVVPATGSSDGAVVQELPAALPAVTCTAPAAQTIAMTEGPYYKAGAPERTSLLEEGATGTKLTLTGYVLNTNCQPVAGAVVDFWQADGAGAYDNDGYRFRGQQVTDQNGRYQLETVVPGEYPGRTPHIHVKVQAPGGTVLTSQVFFPDSAQNQTDSIFDPSLLVTVVNSDSSGMQATYNFVVSP